jgi:drug/metabolite transporter (DMT)-like permease
MSAIARLSEAWHRLPPNARGMLYMTVSSATFAVHDASAKLLGQHYSVYQITFMRFSTALVLFLPFVWWRGWRTIGTKLPWVQGTRAALTVFAQMLAYFALSHMLLAHVTAIAFTRPLFVTLLAVFILTEKPGWRRWAATLIGFGGVILIVNPGAHAGFAGLGWPTLSAILSSLLFATVGVAVRRYSGSEHPNAWMFYYMLAGVIMSAPGAWLTWQTPVPHDVAIAVLLSAIAIVAQAAFIMAFTVGEASAVGPVDYTRLVYATIFGWFIFQELPGATTWAGAAIIVAASYYVAQHEARGRRK